MLQLQNMCIKTRQIYNELEILTPYKMNMMSYIDQLLEKISWIKNVAEKGMFDKRKKMRNAFTYCIYTQIKTDICLK